MKTNYQQRVNSSKGEKMVKFSSKEEYEKWRNNKAKGEEPSQEQTVKKNSAGGVTDGRKMVEEKAAQKKAYREEFEKESAAKIQSSKQKIIPDPPTFFLSSIFSALSILSFISGCILALVSWPKSEYGNAFYDLQVSASIFWFISGIIEAAIFAFFGQALKYLRGIYENTFKVN